MADKYASTFVKTMVGQVGGTGSDTKKNWTQINAEKKEQKSEDRSKLFAAKRHRKHKKIKTTQIPSTLRLVRQAHHKQAQYRQAQDK